MTSEETVFRTIELPNGQSWAWYPDLNIIAFAPHLDCAGRQRAIDEIQAQWRREHMRLAESA